MATNTAPPMTEAAAAQAPTTVTSPPAYLTNGVNGGEKQLPVPQTAQQTTLTAPVAVPVAAAIVADNAIAADAIRLTYLQYITIRNVKEVRGDVVPPELASRGVTPQDFQEVLTQVKQIKSDSDRNKIFLWTGCIFCCGIIGYLLVAQRAVGNKKLSKQLETPLEEMNRKLMQRNINVRWTWTDGSLRGYYK